MARKRYSSSFTEKLYYDNTLFSGILANTDAHAEGSFKHLVNFDIADTGQSITPRKGYINTFMILVNEQGVEQAKLCIEDPIYFKDATTGDLILVDFSKYPSNFAFRVPCDTLQSDKFIAYPIESYGLEAESGEDTIYLEDYTDLISSIQPVWGHQAFHTKGTDLINKYIIKVSNTTDIFWIMFIYNSYEDKLLVTINNTNDTVNIFQRNLASPLSIVPNPKIIICEDNEDAIAKNITYNQFPFIWIKQNNKYLMETIQTIDGITIEPSFYLLPPKDNYEWVYTYEFVSTYDMADEIGLPVLKYPVRRLSDNTLLKKENLYPGTINATTTSQVYVTDNIYSYLYINGYEIKREGISIKIPSPDYLIDLINNKDLTPKFFNPASKSADELLKELIDRSIYPVPVDDCYYKMQNNLNADMYKYINITNYGTSVGMVPYTKSEENTASRTSILNTYYTICIKLVTNYDILYTLGERLTCKYIDSTDSEQTFTYPYTPVSNPLNIDSDYSKVVFPQSYYKDVKAIDTLRVSVELEADAALYIPEGVNLACTIDNTTSYYTAYYIFKNEDALRDSYIYDEAFKNTYGLKDQMNKSLTYHLYLVGGVTLEDSKITIGKFSIYRPMLNDIEHSLEFYANATGVDYEPLYIYIYTKCFNYYMFIDITEGFNNVKDLYDNSGANKLSTYLNTYDFENNCFTPNVLLNYLVYNSDMSYSNITLPNNLLHIFSEGVSFVMYIAQVPTASAISGTILTLDDFYNRALILNTDIHSSRLLSLASNIPTYITETIVEDPANIKNAEQFCIFKSVEGDRLVVWKDNLVYMSEADKLYYFLDKYIFPEEVYKVVPFKDKLLVFTSMNMYSIYPYEETSTQEVTDDEGNTKQVQVKTITYNMLPVLYNIYTDKKYLDVIKVYNSIVLFYSTTGQLYLITPSATIDSDTIFTIKYLNASANDILLNYVTYINERLHVYGYDPIVDSDVVIKSSVSLTHIKIYYSVHKYNYTYILIYDTTNNRYYVYDTNVCGDVLDVFNMNYGMVAISKINTGAEYTSICTTTLDKDYMYNEPIEYGNQLYYSNCDKCTKDGFSFELYDINTELDTGILYLNNHLKKRTRNVHVIYKNLDALTLEFSLDMLMDDIFINTVMSDTFELTNINNKYAVEKVTNNIDLLADNHALFDFSAFTSNKIITHNTSIPALGKNIEFIFRFKSKGKYKIQGFGLVYKEHNI